MSGLMCQGGLGNTKQPHTIVSSSYPVKRERRGTGTTRAIPSRTAATCSSNSWSLKKNKNKNKSCLHVYLDLLGTLLCWYQALYTVPLPTHHSEDWEEGSGWHSSYPTLLSSPRLAHRTQPYWLTTATHTRSTVRWVVTVPHRTGATMPGYRHTWVGGGLISLWGLSLNEHIVFTSLFYGNLETSSGNNKYSEH